MLHLDIKKVCILLNVELPKYEEVENKIYRCVPC